MTSLFQRPPNPHPHPHPSPSPHPPPSLPGQSTLQLLPCSGNTRPVVRGIGAVNASASARGSAPMNAEKHAALGIMQRQLWKYNATVGTFQAAEDGWCLNLGDCKTADGTRVDLFPWIYDGGGGGGGGKGGDSKSGGSGSGGGGNVEQPGVPGFLQLDEIAKLLSQKEGDMPEEVYDEIAAHLQRSVKAIWQLVCSSNAIEDTEELRLCAVLCNLTSYSAVVRYMHVCVRVDVRLRR